MKLIDFDQSTLNKIVLGCSESHLVQVDDHTYLHQNVSQPWAALCEAGKVAGFDLAIASGFRSFERQQFIWDQKLSGNRPVMDDQQRPIELMSFSPLERIKAVMRWSALPGASRHHWGTELDIYDRRAIADDYRLQLIPEEYQSGGPFAPMIHWLEDYLSSAGSDFYFPYGKDTGGIAPEPWHISYQPVANHLCENWNLELLTARLEASTLVHKEVVLENLTSLYEQFIQPSLQPSLCKQRQPD